MGPETWGDPGINWREIEKVSNKLTVMIFLRKGLNGRLLK